MKKGPKRGTTSNHLMPAHTERLFQPRNEFWLRMASVIALVLLPLQIFPSLWQHIVGVLDVCNWSPSAWRIAANGMFLLGIVGIYCTNHGNRLWLWLPIDAAVLAIVFQCVPSLWHGTVEFVIAIYAATISMGSALMAMANVKHWSATSWFVANVFFVMCLVGFRVGQYFKLNLNFKQARLARQQRLATERDEAERVRQIQQSRELRELAEAGRRKRMY